MQTFYIIAIYLSVLADVTPAITGEPRRKETHAPCREVQYLLPPLSSPGLVTRIEPDPSKRPCMHAHMLLLLLLTLLPLLLLLPFRCRRKK